MEVEKKPNVDVEAHAPRTRSKIPFSNHVAGTYRFGEIQPHWCAEVENNDELPLRFAHNVRSFNLAAPLLSDIKMKKASFQVPMEAILPLNWDKIYTNPVVGDDVVAENVNCVIPNFPQALHDVIDAWLSSNDITNLDVTDASTLAPAFNSALKLLIFSEYFLSAGSLFASLGIHLNSLYGGSYKNFDIFFDACISKLINVITAAGDYISISIGSGQNTSRHLYSVRYFTDSTRPDDDTAISLGWFLDYIRDDFNWVRLPFGLNFATVVKDFVDTVVGGLSVFTYVVSGVAPQYPLNIKRLLAYQLVCAHFFTNDKIDYVYSAELYRQQIYSALKNYASIDQLGSYDPDSMFTLNGLSYRYDALAGYHLTQIFANVANRNDIQCFSAMADVCRLMFGFRRSLRFMDYFTGAKSNPLAVGDVNVQVNNGYVNAVDITRNIQRQRFFNFVQRVGRKFEDYTSKLGGTYVAPDWHNPIWLGETSDTIYTAEVENTNVNPQAASQPSQSVIGNFRSNASQFIFETHFDRPSVIIAVTYFDIARYYTRNIEKQNFHVDRFDMFNPFMQFIGDQKISRAELNGRSDYALTFGYALRHSEYKTRVNYAFGGFAAGQLPAWEFVADEARSPLLEENISPDYIRSRPSELDMMFLSLTGFSRGTYFHFIIDNYCDCDNMVRPMAYAPEIL